MEIVILTWESSRPTVGHMNLSGVAAGLAARHVLHLQEHDDGEEEGDGGPHLVQAAGRPAGVLGHGGGGEGGAAAPPVPPCLGPLCSHPGREPDPETWRVRSLNQRWCYSHVCRVFLSLDVDSSL